MSEIAGEPTLMSVPSRTSSTRSSFTDEPGSAARRSTRTLSPGATRYCLPPLTMTADNDASGLGTKGDITGEEGARLDQQRAPERHRPDQAKRRPGGHG